MPILLWVVYPLAIWRACVSMMSGATPFAAERSTESELSSFN
jgi:hypothetical protein